MLLEGGEQGGQVPVLVAVDKWMSRIIASQSIDQSIDQSVNRLDAFPLSATIEWHLQVASSPLNKLNSPLHSVPSRAEAARQALEPSACMVRLPLARVQHHHALVSRPA